MTGPAAARAAPRAILFLHSSAGRYGADRQLAAIAAGLDRDRWRAICVLPERGTLATELEAAGARVVLHPLAVLRRATATARGARLLARAIAHDARELGRLARAEGVAVVHANTSVVLSGGAVARASGAAHVVHVREIYAGAAGRAAAALWPLQRRRLERADALVCISHAVARQFARDARVHVVHDGLPRVPDPAPRGEARARLGLTGGRFAALLLGRVSDWKGQDVLVRALAQTPLVANGTVALLAGDPVAGNEAEEARIESLAGRLGVAGRVRMMGFRDDVDDLLGAADALVVPSTRPEPLGLVAMEGLAAGLPVVASAHGGVTEVVRHLHTGLTVPPRSPLALARALRWLADNPERARAMGERGRADVAERFTLGRMRAELDAVWRAAAAARGQT